MIYSDELIFSVYINKIKIIILNTKYIYYNVNVKGDDMKREHKKKLIAPTIAMIAFLILFILLLVNNVFTNLYYNVSVILCIISALLPLGAIGVLIYVYILRVKEIKEGKEDDISKY